MLLRALLVAPPVIAARGYGSQLRNDEEQEHEPPMHLCWGRWERSRAADASVLGSVGEVEGDGGRLEQQAVPRRGCRLGERVDSTRTIFWEVGGGRCRALEVCLGFGCATWRGVQAGLLGFLQLVAGDLDPDLAVLLPLRRRAYGSARGPRKPCLFTLKKWCMHSRRIPAF